ncbi:MAG: hypothetical protein Q8J92_13350 [Parvibaculum sp.]|nr:hypothetical protein [Parvibaculum sp.]
MEEERFLVGKLAPFLAHAIEYPDFRLEARQPGIPPEARPSGACPGSRFVGWRSVNNKPPPLILPDFQRAGPLFQAAAVLLERFSEKWNPVFRKEARPNNNLESFSVSTKH